MWEKLERVGLIISSIVFIALGYFSYQNFVNNQKLSSSLNSIESQIAKLPVTDYQLPITELSCDSICVRKIVDDAMASVSGISKNDKEQVAEKIVEKVIAPAAQIKSQYVPLGAGSTSSTDWIDAPGAQVTLNLADFGNISQIYFEAQLSSPSSGKVFARLWDSLTGAVSGSEISANSGDAQLVSAKVSISSGGRTIKVQLKSEVQQPVSVLNSRLRIDTR